MTNTDTQWTTRFPGLSATTFVANSVDLANYTRTESPINDGMLGAIGRAMIYENDVQESFYDRFMQSPLTYGDSVMSARFSEVASRAYDPLAADTALFNATRPSMVSNIAKQNFSRQIAVEIHEAKIKQFMQTPEMIGDVRSAIMASSMVAYRDDMWVAGKEFFSGSVRSAKDAQQYIMTASPGDAEFADEMNEVLWDFAQNKFGYKSTGYNASGFNTKSNSVSIAMKKSAEYPAFKKLYSETFNPSFIRVTQSIDYVDDFATPAGKKSGAGELLAMVVDNRAFKITPMPDTLVTESFRNPARRSTSFFTTYEYAFQHDPFFNVAYIFAPSGA